MKEWASTLMTPVKVTHTVFVFASQFLLAPFITISMLFVFRWFSSGTAATLARAFSVGACSTLPPSPSLTASLTSLAGGSDGFAFLISTLVNTIGIALVPFLAQLTVTAAGLEETQTPGKFLGVAVREATQLISYLVLTTLLPMGLGCFVQNALLVNSSTKNNNIVNEAGNEESSCMMEGNNSSSSSTEHNSINNKSAVDQQQHANNNNNNGRLMSLIETCCPTPAMNNSHHHADQEGKKDHPQSLSYYDNSFEEDNRVTELCFGRFFFSRARVRHWTGIVSFVLRYCCFILMFQQAQMMDVDLLNDHHHNHQLKTSFIHALADPASLLSWSQLLKTLLFGILVTVAHSIVCWFSTKIAMSFANSQQQLQQQNNSNNMPRSNIIINNSKSSSSSLSSQQQQTEDRIALFLTCVQKSDLLIAPIYSYLFVSKIEGRVVVLMSHAFIFCFANTLTLALFSIGPLQEWKRRQLLRPGASFLPSKFSRIPSHHLALAPTTSGNNSNNGNDNTTTISSVPRDRSGLHRHHHHQSYHHQEDNHSSTIMNSNADEGVNNNTSNLQAVLGVDHHQQQQQQQQAEDVVKKVSTNIQNVASNLVKAALRTKSDHAKD